MTDIWFRNAQSCMSVCAEEGVTRLTWTRQHLGRLRMDGILFVRQFYMHTALRPKIRLVGIQGTAEYSIFGRFDKPDAVYPTWSGKGDSLDDLQRLMDNPWGKNEELCNDKRVPSSLRPTFGQKHLIVIHNCPSPTSGVGQQFWAKIAAIQHARQDVEFFINGTGSYAVLFGLRFRSCDFGLSDAGDVNNHLYLPNGIKIKLDQGEVAKLYQWEDWIRILGFTIDSVVKNKNNERYRMRIRSLRWAAKHWADNFRFHREDRNIAVDTVSGDADFVPPQSKSIVLRRKLYTLREADKILCNRCRIAPGCRFFRVDSVCGYRDSEMTDLANYFQSRNAGLIVDGLAEIVRLQAQRLEGALGNEAQSSELDPEVTKLMKQVFDSGVKLAKLVDPHLAGPGTRVQVNVGVGAGGSAEIVSMTNPRDLMAGIVNQLEARGIPRDKITPEMVEGVLKGMVANTQPLAIESQVLKAEDVLGQRAGVSENSLLPVMPVSDDKS